MARKHAGSPHPRPSAPAGGTAFQPSSPGSQPPSKIIIKDMTGLYTNTDAADIPPGAAREQVNVCAEQEGVFRVRMGFVKIFFQD